MYLVYVDEAKVQPKVQPYYYLCGLAIREEDMASIEDRLDKLAHGYFPSRGGNVGDEFHAVHLVNGQGPFKGHDLAGRVQLFKDLTTVIDDHPKIGRIAVRIDVSRLSRDDYQRIALMFFTERVEQLMRARISRALLIVDHDKDFVSMNVSSLAAFKAKGTDFAYGMPITRVVDTVHHTHSHHSRLLQLADIYTYAVAMEEQNPTKYPRSELVKHIKGLQNFYQSKFKYWPADPIF